MKKFRHTPAVAAAALFMALAGPTAAATFSWISGDFLSGITAPNPLGAGDVLNVIGGVGNPTRFTAVTFVNDGTVNWFNTVIQFANGAIVNNSGLWDAKVDDKALTYIGGSPTTFNNSGTLRKSGGSGTVTIGNMPEFRFVNSGVIDAQAGTVLFSGGSTFNSGTVFTGAGSVLINGNSAYSGAIQSSNLVWTGGAVHTGTNAAMSGSVMWESGNISGGWTLNPGSTLEVRGLNSKRFDGGTFTNNGTINWQSFVQLTTNGTLVNAGVLDSQGNSVFGGVGTINNSGIIRKSSGTGETSLSSSDNVSLALINSGTIEAQTGAIGLRSVNTFNPGTVFTGAGRVELSGQSTFNGAFTSSNLVITTRKHTGNGAVLNGQMRWIADASLAGTWAVAPGATLTLQDGQGKVFDGASFTNNGTVALQGTFGGNVLLSNGASVLNAGIWDAQSDTAIVSGVGAISTYNNSGTLLKSVGTGITQIGNQSTVNVINSGTVNAQTGTIAFNGSNTFNPGTVFTGTGSVAVNTASTFNGAFTSSNLNLAGGRQTGNAAVLNGQAQWTGGSLAGTWAVAPAATLNLRGAGGKGFDAGTVTNEGTVAWQAGSGDLVFNNGGRVVNNGVWDVQNDAAMTFITAEAGSFTNNGVFRKTAGTGTTSLSNPVFVSNTASPSFVNNGTVDVQVGTIRLSTMFNNAGKLMGNGTLQSSGGITNSGTVAPGSFGTGTLALTGSIFGGPMLTQTASAVFAVDLTSLTAFDLLTVAGSAILNGALALNCLGVCSFAVGDSITILDATNTLSGTFSSVSLSGFGSGAFNVIYDLPNANVRLLVTQAVTAVPEPGSWALMAGGLGALGFLSRRRRSRFSSAGKCI